jgi:hypothetical protein
MQLFDGRQVPNAWWDTATAVRTAKSTLVSNEALAPDQCTNAGWELADGVSSDIKQLEIRQLAQVLGQGVDLVVFEG